jgi:hypothetical protein
MDLPPGFSAEAEHTPRSTLRLNLTADAPGVIVGGVKAQVAFSGSELCRHDNVISSLGSPVFASSAVVNVAEPSADTVCPSGEGATGAATIAIGYEAETLGFASRTAVITTVAGVGTTVGAV